MVKSKIHTGAAGDGVQSGSGTAEIKQLFNRFLELEEPFFQRDIGGFRYWHYIRFHVFTDMLFQLKWITYTDVRKHTPVFKLIGLALSLLKNSMLHSVMSDRTRSPLLFLQTSHSVVHRGQRINPFTTLLRQSLTGKATVWETPMRWSHAPLSDRENLYFLDALHLWSFVRELLQPSPGALIREEIRFLNGLFQDLGIRLPEQRLRFLIRRVIRLKKSFSGPVRRMLKRKGVKVIILVNHYDPVKMVVTEVARTMGIHVVGLQHGSMGRYNIGYNFADVGPLPTLPDEIWTFGPFWTTTARIGQTGLRLLAMGSPYVEERVKDTVRTADTPKTTVLIISQWTLASDFERTALDLARDLDRDRYRIVYKLHPGEWQIWRATYSEAFLTAGITVVEDGDLYQLFSEADVIIGVYSTALIESLHFGKQLILLNRYGIHFFEELIQSGRVMPAENGRDIVEFIRNTDLSERRVYETDTFWTSGSLALMTSRLDLLLGTAEEKQV
ncbi:hypothetical protein JXO52_02935 [bacterium]|nr:hypothetical protein [bacterium]